MYAYNMTDILNSNKICMVLYIVQFIIYMY
jgi:hypothetical protein